MGLLKCKHDWRLLERSNVLQLDDMGYPLRLCIFRCNKCGKSDQQWVDVPKKELAEIDAGKSVLLRWM